MKKRIFLISELPNGVDIHSYIIDEDDIREDENEYGDEDTSGWNIEKVLDSRNKVLSKHDNWIEITEQMEAYCKSNGKD